MVIATTVTFEVDSPISDLVGVVLSAKIWLDVSVSITGSISTSGNTVTMTFDGANLVPGEWSGQLGHPNDMLATFAFEVVQSH